MEDQKPTSASGMTMAVGFCMLLCAYVFAYTQLSKRVEFQEPGDARTIRYRIACYQWEADLFIPAVFVESCMRGVKIQSIYSDDSLAPSAIKAQPARGLIQISLAAKK
jgi:hypothetical protein